MAVSNIAKKHALVSAAEEEFRDLESRGVRLAGNVFSTILLVKGSLNKRECAGDPLLGGSDGSALHSALLKLGYAPEDFCALSAADQPGSVGEMSAGVFRRALEALDPEAVVLLDDAAADAMREAYPDALAQIEDFRCASLECGLVVRVLGRRVLALDGFEQALKSPERKQRMWAYLKQLPPLGAPY